MTELVKGKDPFLTPDPILIPLYRNYHWSFQWLSTTADTVPRSTGRCVGAFLIIKGQGDAIVLEWMGSKDVKLPTVIQEVLYNEDCTIQRPTALTLGTLIGAVPRNQASGVRSSPLLLCYVTGQVTNPPQSFWKSAFYTRWELTSFSLWLAQILSSHLVGPSKEANSGQQQMLPMTHRCMQSKTPNPSLCQSLGLSGFTAKLDL